VVINMVGSIDGKATIDGKAEPIGSQTDRVLMRTLRSRADAVMVGAGTLRAEKLTLAVPESLARGREARGLRAQPLAVVATASGDVPLRTNLLSSSPDNLLLLVSPETPKEHLAALSTHGSLEVVPKGTATTSQENVSPAAEPGSRLDLTRALEVLRERHAVDVLLVEGGPALNHALISGGLADELFLTLAPQLLGGARPDVLAVLEGPALRLPNPPVSGLVSVHLCESELFLRYLLNPLSHHRIERG
jgi:riboflavin biosynthesis pyrimidine reductase